MQLRYGTHNFAENKIAYTRSISIQRFQTGVPAYADERWDINGRISGNGSQDISAKSRELQQQLVDGKDLVFVDNNGVVTSDAMLNADQINGCQCDAIRWLTSGGSPFESGAEFVSMRTFQVVIRGRRPASPASTILSWNERVSVIGTGGQKFVMSGSVVGPTLKMVTQLATPVMVIQSGRAIGLGQYPVIPPPIFPDHEHVDMRFIDSSTPQSWGKTNGFNTQFSVAWRYTFEMSIGVVSGIPRPNSYQ